ncbi:MAG: FtsX-like permease family protein [Lachnospiraceae bacterium]|nr:FtsX-like permease family protein [Lachnospiraceae bacterium]
MKSYLSLIPISARVHRRKNRLTLLCIIISVFLVTTVFSMADMLIRAERTRMMDKHGNWHIRLEGITPSDASEIGQRPDVATAGWYDVYNYDASKPYYVGDKKAALYGVDEAYITRIRNGLTEGSFPQNDEEIMLGTNAKSILNVSVGDTVTISTPAGSLSYVISGFGEDDPSYYQGVTYLIGVYMTPDAFRTLMSSNGIGDCSPSYYVQFQTAAKAAKAITELQKLYGLSEDNISENVGVMGMTGYSGNKLMKNYYGIAAILFVLVLLSGVLMISGSMNSNIIQRTKFFGMMRCIGASRRQIIRFVRLEALNWCKIAVPAGILLGTLVTWGLCATLRLGIGNEFSVIPLFQFSAAGITSGIVVGIVTVLLAAQSPARRAAGVSPVTAVSGGTESIQTIRHAATMHFARIDTALGIHHAVSAKKNLFLMTDSFALTIIMFLCFSVGMDFARVLLPSLRSWQPDCTIVGYSNALILSRELLDEISIIPGVEHVYGNIYMSDIPASSPQSSIDHINLVSYDEYMLDCSAKSVVSGDLSKVYGDSDQVLTIYNKNNPLRVGDTIQLAGTQVEVACAVSDGLFADDLIVICSEETFVRLMGEQNYAMINVQLSDDATEESVQRISALVNNDQIFSDNRKSNQSSNSTYYATRIIGYGFLGTIGMITVFYIINSISISVSAKSNQYGAMRAVGMDGHQLTKMIAAEAFSYVVLGFIVGCAIGLPLSRYIYTLMITSHFGVTWTIPFSQLAIIFLFVFASSAIAVYAPSKRIRNMAITDTINEL